MRSMFLQPHYLVSSQGIQVMNMAHCPACNQLLDANFNNLIPRCPHCGESLNWQEEGINYANSRLWQPTFDVDYNTYVDWCLAQPQYVIKKLTNNEDKVLVFIAESEKAMKMFTDFQHVKTIEDANESVLFKYLMTQKHGQPKWEELGTI